MDTWREREQRDRRAYLIELLAHAGGNVVEAARIAGVHRSAMYKMLARYGVPAPPKVQPDPAAFQRARMIARMGASRG